MLVLASCIVRGCLAIRPTRRRCLQVEGSSRSARSQRRTPLRILSARRSRGGVGQGLLPGRGTAATSPVFVIGSDLPSLLLLTEVLLMEVLPKVKEASPSMTERPKDASQLRTARILSPVAALQAE